MAISSNQRHEALRLRSEMPGCYRPAAGSPRREGRCGLAWRSPLPASRAARLLKGSAPREGDIRPDSRVRVQAELRRPPHQRAAPSTAAALQKVDGARPLAVVLGLAIHGHVLRWHERPVEFQRRIKQRGYASLVEFTSNHGQAFRDNCEQRKIRAHVVNSDHQAVCVCALASDANAMRECRVLGNRGTPPPSAAVLGPAERAS